MTCERPSDQSLLKSPYYPRIGQEWALYPSSFHLTLWQCRAREMENQWNQCNTVVDKLWNSSKITPWFYKNCHWGDVWWGGWLCGEMESWEGRRHKGWPMGLEAGMGGCGDPPLMGELGGYNKHSTSSCADTDSVFIDTRVPLRRHWYSQVMIPPWLMPHI